MSEEKKEKEIVIDLSKKIKFSETLYVSIGTMLLSFLIMIVHLLIHLSHNNWMWDWDMLSVLLNFVFAIRSGDTTKHDNKIKEDHGG